MPLRWRPASEYGFAAGWLRLTGVLALSTVCLMAFQEPCIASGLMCCLVSPGLALSKPMALPGSERMAGRHIQASAAHDLSRP